MLSISFALLSFFLLIPISNLQIDLEFLFEFHIDLEFFSNFIASLDDSDLKF